MRPPVRVRVRVRLRITFLYLAVEVDGVHAGCDDARVAVSGAHDARHLIHQLHGHTWKAAQNMEVRGGSWYYPPPPLTAPTPRELAGNRHSLTCIGIHWNCRWIKGSAT